MPAVLPSVSDLQTALEILEPKPVDREHLAFCFAKLMAGLEPTTKLTADDTRLRLSVWYETCADLGNELWSKATLLALQSSKWMPKPAEFRALVADKLADRSRKITRCRAMLAKQRQGDTAAGGKPAGMLETPQERMRHTIARLRTMPGHFPRAVGYERDLAAMENREPEAWIHEPPVGDEQPQTTPAGPKRTVEQQAAVTKTREAYRSFAERGIPATTGRATTGATEEPPPDFDAERVGMVDDFAEGAAA
jgi:hypothetical protein